MFVWLIYRCWWFVRWANTLVRMLRSAQANDSWCQRAIRQPYDYQLFIWTSESEELVHMQPVCRKAQTAACASRHFTSVLQQCTPQYVACITEASNFEPLKRMLINWFFRCSSIIFGLFDAYWSILPELGDNWLPSEWRQSEKWIFCSFRYEIHSPNRLIDWCMALLANSLLEHLKQKNFFCQTAWIRTFGFQTAHVKFTLWTVCFSRIIRLDYLLDYLLVLIDGRYQFDIDGLNYRSSWNYRFLWNSTWSPEFRAWTAWWALLENFSLALKVRKRFETEVKN